jgi:hypothetical protein
MSKAEVFGYLAAAVWLASACIRLPRDIWFTSHAGGGGRNEKLETLVRRLTIMSWLNFVAACLTAASVFFSVHDLV